MNSESFRQNKTKQKEKKNTRICFPNTLSVKFQQIALKFATLYLFYPFLSCFFVENSFLKTLLSVLSFRTSIRTRKLRNLLFKLTVWTYCLNLAFNIAH